MKTSIFFFIFLFFLGASLANAQEEVSQEMINVALFEIKEAAASNSDVIVYPKHFEIYNNQNKIIWVYHGKNKLRQGVIKHQDELIIGATINEDHYLYYQNGNLGVYLVSDCKGPYLCFGDHYSPQSAEQIDNFKEWLQKITTAIKKE
mgnify:CR=1 FL=1